MTKSIFLQDSKLGCTESKSAANPSRRSEQRICACCGMASLKVPRADTIQSVSELSGRKKVTLSPGHSLMDWIRLGRSQGDLSGVKDKRTDMTLADLATHNHPNDMWMALRGKVYNITPYINYHPGGVEELMRAAGKDGTDLFDDIHNWVNVESMLEKCLVGHLGSSAKKASVKKILPKKPPPGPGSSIIRPPVTIEQPKQDWYQNDRQLVVVVYTKLFTLIREFVTVEIMPDDVTIQVILDKYSYFVHFKPAFALKDTATVDVNKGKVEVKFVKVIEGVQWQYHGQELDKNHVYSFTKSLAPTYRKWKVTENSRVTHDTRLLRLKAPPGYIMSAPVGYHIHIINNISGMQIGRSYTIMSPSIDNSKTDTEQEEGRAIHLMIKYYLGGTLTPWVTSVSVGDSISVSNYDGNFELQRLNDITHLILFAAGTGFTSMARLINYALKNIVNATFQVKLIFNNKTQADILWREQLDNVADANQRFSVVHVLSQEPQGSDWTGLRGHISAGIVEDFVPIPNAKCRPLVCICGPWAYNDTVESLTKLRGLKDEHLHIFCQTA
ncbi:hypothetical protein RRG08_065954 [Elysia crispata]|uniref:Flavohemoprotein b5/b5R n=1 Tax=Elysia crispata TaxID=231223 RepID=A0AAE1DG63_9GAST|nr:hypothetical protein RRG08_065954 [Elysia crispata]